MAYKQWIGLKIRNRFRKSDIRIKNAKLESGKFYQGSKDNEIPASDIDKMVIGPQSQDVVYSCGRSDAAIGTEGEITLYEWDGEHETKICRIYWSAPWGAYPNILSTRDYDASTSEYVINKDDVQQDSTIGNVEVVVAKMA